MTQVYGYYARQRACNGCGQKIRKIEVRAFETVAHGKHEHAQQHINDARYQTFEGTRVRISETYRDSDEECHGFDDVISHGDGGVFQRSPSHDKGEHQHGGERYEQGGERCFQYVDAVFFSISAFFILQGYAFVRPFMRWRGCRKVCGKCPISASEAAKRSVPLSKCPFYRGDASFYYEIGGEFRI